MKQYLTATLIIWGISASFHPLLSAYDSNDRNAQVQIMTILSNNENKLNTLNERVKYVQDNYSGLYQEINSLKQSLAIEKQKNDKFERDLAALRQQMNADKIQMQKSLDGAIDKIAQETSKVVNAAVKTQPAPAASTAQDFSSGKFYQYKVQQGATLTTIAKAYKVSVDSIKKANNLKDDNIYSDQILLIPKIN